MPDTPTADTTEIQPATVSVEAGMKFADLNRELAANGQMIPLDGPYSESATVGGMIAARENRLLALSSLPQFLTGWRKTVAAQVSGVFSAPSHNVFLVKFSYWLNM